MNALISLIDWFSSLNQYEAAFFLGGAVCAAWLLLGLLARTFLAGGYAGDHTDDEKGDK